MIESRYYVPNYYEKSRDYQVFLKLLDLVINASKADIDYFTSLISPEQCKARILPLLSNYVGYEYDYAEKVRFNRIITKNFASLKRNRGSLNGITMAVALAFAQLEDLDDADIFNLFSVDYVKEKNKFGKEINKFRIYLYYHAYLSKLHYLIEQVRPAGTLVEIIPAIPINAQETVVLTDEYRMLGYDYTTGLLIKINDIPIYVEDCWEILKEGKSTGVFLVNNEFFDANNNQLNYYLDDNQNFVDSQTGELIGKTIKAPHIYKGKITKTNSGESILTDLVYTGEYFNLDYSARILNCAYELRKGGVSLNYLVDGNTWIITDSLKSKANYILIDDLEKGYKKVYEYLPNNQLGAKYNWHLNLNTGYFEEDNDGESILSSNSTIPWDKYTYISKKKFITNTTETGVTYTTSYFVNKYGDVEDNSGNIILSQKDRYKVSDSGSVGFSEVHNMTKPTTYDKTWIRGRSSSYSWDVDYYKNKNKEDYNDYENSAVAKDTRIKITAADMRIDKIIREYDTSNNIGIINADYDGEVTKNKAQIIIDKAASDIITNADDVNKTPALYLDINLRPDDDILSIFKELRFTFNNEEVSSDKTVILDWKLAENANLYYNTYDLPERITFPHMGEITKKKLYFTDTPLIVSPKTYDGTISVPSTYKIIGGDTNGA